MKGSAGYMKTLSKFFFGITLLILISAIVLPVSYYNLDDI